MTTATEPTRTSTCPAPIDGATPDSAQVGRGQGKLGWTPDPVDADVERCLANGPWLPAEVDVASVMVGGLRGSDTLRDVPQALIAKAAGVSLRKLARVLNVFEKAGTIVRLARRSGKGAHRKGRPRDELDAYQIDLERLRAWAGQPRPAEWGGRQRCGSGRLAATRADGRRGQGDA